MSRYERELQVNNTPLQKHSLWFSSDPVRWLSSWRAGRTTSNNIQNTTMQCELVMRKEVKERHACLSTKANLLSSQVHLFKNADKKRFSVFVLSLSRMEEPRWNLIVLWKPKKPRALTDWSLDLKNCQESKHCSLNPSNTNSAGFNGLSIFASFHLVFFNGCLKNGKIPAPYGFIQCTKTAYGDICGTLLQTITLWKLESNVQHLLNKYSCTVCRCITRICLLLKEQTLVQTHLQSAKI